MRKSKLIIFIATLALLVFTLSACSNTESNEAKKPDTVTETTESNQNTDVKTPETEETKIETTEQTGVYLDSLDKLSDYTEIKDVNGLSFYILSSIVDSCSSFEDYSGALISLMSGEISDEVEDILSRPIVISDEQSYNISDINGSLVIAVYNFKYTELFDVPDNFNDFDDAYINGILDEIINNQYNETEDITDETEYEADTSEQDIIKVSDIYVNDIIAKDNDKIIAKVSGRLFGNEGYDDVPEYGYITLLYTTDGLNIILTLSSDESSDWPIVSAQSLVECTNNNNCSICNSCANDCCIADNKTACCNQDGTCTQECLNGSCNQDGTCSLNCCNTIYSENKSN